MNERRSGRLRWCCAALAGLTALAAAQAPVAGAEAGAESPECRKVEQQLLGVVAEQGVCELADPEHAQPQTDYENWMARWAHCWPADRETLVATIRKRAQRDYVNAVEAEKRRARADCAEQANEIAAIMRPASAHLASPQATWNEFRAALLAGDRKRALRCTVARPVHPEQVAPFRDDADALITMPADALARFGASLPDIHSTVVDGQTALDAPIETLRAGKKESSVVWFRKRNDNWFIEAVLTPPPTLDMIPGPASRH